MLMKLITAYKNTRKKKSADTPHTQYSDPYLERIINELDLNKTNVVVKPSTKTETNKGNK